MLCCAVLCPASTGGFFHHCPTLRYPTLHYTALHCTALHCTALLYTALHCTVPPCCCMSLCRYGLQCSVLYCTVYCVLCIGHYSIYYILQIITGFIRSVPGLSSQPHTITATECHFPLVYTNTTYTLLVHYKSHKGAKARSCCTVMAKSTAAKHSTCESIVWCVAA